MTTFLDVPARDTIVGTQLFDILSKVHVLIMSFLAYTEQIC